MANDIIYLKGLRCECIIGTKEWEKQLKQTLVLDIEVKTDISKAAETDDLNHAVNYQEIAEKVTDYLQQSKAELIETVGEGIAKLILEQFKVSWVRITIDKGAAVSGVKNVGLVIERKSA